MDLNSLRYFRAVARSGSITAAARSLGVSQPTLSVAIRNLEDGLNTRLLERTRAGVVTTLTGEALLEHAEAILALVDSATARVRELQDEVVGQFVLGFVEPLGAAFLPEFLPPFLSRYASLELDLSSGSTESIRQSVLDRAIHFGLVIGCQPADDLVMMDLFQDSVELFVGATSRAEVPLPAGWKESLLAPRRDSLRPGRLSPPEPSQESAVQLGREDSIRLLHRGPLIWAEHAGSRSMLQQLEAQSLAPARKMRCAGLDLVRRLTAAGAGVGILPRRLADSAGGVPMKRLAPDLPRILEPIQLIFRGDLHRTRAAITLKDALLERGRQMDSAWPELSLAPK